MDGRVDDDLVDLLVVDDHAEDAKGITALQAPGPECKHTPLLADGRLAPAIGRFRADAAHDGRPVAGHVGMVDDLYPEGGQQAVVADLEILAQPVADGHPAKAQLAPAAEPFRQRPDPDE